MSHVILLEIVYIELDKVDVCSCGLVVSVMGSRLVRTSRVRHCLNAHVKYGSHVVIWTA